MRKCKCGHDVDLHTLADISLDGTPGDPDMIRFRWRFVCSGIMYGMPCRCSNFGPADLIGAR